jgi:hypothetical protein
MATTVRPTPSRLSGKRVRIAIGSGAKATEIAAILERVYGISGCDGCGRNGYDIVIGHGDPVFRDFNVPGVSVIVEDLKSQVG